LLLTELAGRITGELERSSQAIGLADPMIAAIAVHHGLELVTGNTAHFQRVQQLGYKLTLANWRSDTQTSGAGEFSHVPARSLPIHIER
jgi:hypothetical protein